MDSISDSMAKLLGAWALLCNVSRKRRSIYDSMYVSRSRTKGFEQLGVFCAQGWMVGLIYFPLLNGGFLTAYERKPARHADLFVAVIVVVVVSMPGLILQE